MVDERWQQFWGSTEEPDEEIALQVIANLEAALDEGSSYLDMMYAAYQRVTDIPPDEVVLVESKSPDGRKLYQYITKEEAEEMVRAW